MSNREGLNKTRKMVFLSLLLALALVLSLLETIIPMPLPVPGAKLGLSNLIILTSLLVFGFKEALIIALLKSLALLLVTGNTGSFIYSFTGGLFSTLVMGLLLTLFKGKISVSFVSILGAISHNFGQVTVAVIILQNLGVYSYLPILIILSLFTGYFVGLSASYLSIHLRKII